MIEVFGLSENSAGTCLGPDRWRAQGSNWITSYSPTTGESIGRVRQTTMEEYHELMGHALETAKAWSKVPAPQRGEAIRLIGVALREHKTALGQLISLEMGKILAEGEGEGIAKVILRILSTSAQWTTSVQERTAPGYRWLPL